MGYCKKTIEYLNRPVSDILKDPCFRRNLQGMLNASTSSTSTTYTSSSTGGTFTDSSLINRSVGAIIIDDVTKNQGFTKPFASDTLTFTDGTTIVPGQTITIIFT